MTGTGLGPTTADDKLTWLLESLLERTPGARHALVLSRDGLKLCRTPELSVDQADQLAAIAAGIQALSHGASVEFGDGTGGVRHSMTEFHGGMLFIVEAGEGAHLAVVAAEDADVGLVGHNMNELVEQIGEYLRARPAASSAQPARTSQPGQLSPVRHEPSCGTGQPPEGDSPDRLYTVTGGRSRADARPSTWSR